MAAVAGGTGAGTSTGTSTGTTTASAPTITSFTPVGGDAGNTVTITGTNFSTTASSNTVKFNGTAATVSSATATSLTVTVPTGATTGTIAVTTSGGTATSTSSFSVYTYTVTTFAGTAGSSGTTDGDISIALFNRPTGLCFDSSNNIYIPDHMNHSIRKIIGNTVTTFAGSAGNLGTADGTGSVARFKQPGDCAVDSNGNIFISDYGNHTIRKITSGGTVTTFAGLAGTTGTANGNGSTARFNFPFGMTIDSNDNLYIAEYWNHSIRKITPTADVSTIAGLPGTNGSLDGNGTNARFKNPAGVTLDSNSNIYVTDAVNHAIRKITSTFEVTTFSGALNTSGEVTGEATTSRYSKPVGIVSNTDGSFYIFEADNQTIRRMASDGSSTLLAGKFGTIGITDGNGSSVRLNYPHLAKKDKNNVIYFADTDNHTIRKFVP